MSKRGRSSPTTEVTMREFRAAPAKILRRAARAGTKVKVADFVLIVEAAPSDATDLPLHGSMAANGHVTGDLKQLLSAEDAWDTDE